MVKTKLTTKQKDWLNAIIKYRNPTEAAFQVYNCKNRDVASVISYQNFRKLQITMEDLMDKMGLDTEEDIKDLIRLRKAKRLQSCDVYVQKDENGEYKINENSNDFMEVDDNNAQLKALELTCKLKGRLKERNINIDNSKETHITKIVNYSKR